MNLTGTLQEFIAGILDDSHLSGKQREEKMVQVFDLCCFVETYKPSIKIVDFSKKINVVEEEGIRKGIYFCELAYDTKPPGYMKFCKQKELIVLAHQLDTKEMWLVIVEESFCSNDMAASREFLRNNDIDGICDRIFYFNFSQSIIKTIK